MSRSTDEFCAGCAGLCAMAPVWDEGDPVATWTGTMLVMVVDGEVRFVHQHALCVVAARLP